MSQLQHTQRTKTFKDFILCRNELFRQLFRCPSFIILFVAVVIGGFDTWLFLSWIPSDADTVKNYLYFIADLDIWLRKLRQLEPVYPMATSIIHIFSGLSILATINFTRFLFQTLALYFVGKITQRLAGRWSYVIIAILIFNFNLSFWSLSVNLLRNLHGMTLLLALIWTLLHIFDLKVASWRWRIIAGSLFAAIVATHISVTILMSFSFLMFFLFWLAQLFSPARRSSALPVLKHLFWLIFLAFFFALPYNYIRFYLMQFYKLHEFTLQNSTTASVIAQDTVHSFLNILVNIFEKTYAFFLNFQPTSLHRYVYFVVLLASVYIGIFAWKHKKPDLFFFIVFFLVTFLASQNNFFGINVLPDRFESLLFFPAIIVAVSFFSLLERRGWFHPWFMVTVAFLFFTLQFIKNGTGILLITHVGEKSITDFERSYNLPQLPDVLWKVITPKELRLGHYTGPTTIKNFEEYIVTRTPDSVQMFETSDAETAWKIAKDLKVRYIYMDSDFYNVYHYLLQKNVVFREEKFWNRRYFTPLYQGFTERSKVQLFEVNELPGQEDVFDPPFVRRIIPFAVTSVEDMTILQRAFDESEVKYWSIYFDTGSSHAEPINEYVVLKDETAYQSTHQSGLQVQVQPGLFFKRLIIYPSATPLDRWRVNNIIQTTISDAFLILSTSKNIHRQINFRLEHQGWAMYNRFSLDPQSAAAGKIVKIRYVTRNQLDSIFRIIGFFFMLGVIPLIRKKYTSSSSV